MTELDIGRAIRVAMAERNIKPGWVAEQLGVSPPMVSRLRAGKIAKSTTIARVAAVLGMRPSELVALGEVERDKQWLWSVLIPGNPGPLPC